MINVLVTGMDGPAGVCFAKALLGNNIARVVGVDPDDTELSHKLASTFHQIPLESDAHYIDALNSVITKENIDVVIPMVDEELPILAKNTDRICCKVLISPYETILYTNDKLLMYDKLSAFLPKQINPNSLTIPAFVKPRKGRGSIDVHLVKVLDELKIYNPEQYVFQEVLSPPEVMEYALFDENGKLLICVLREVEMVVGNSVNGRVFRDDALVGIVCEIAKILTLVGPIDFGFMRGTTVYKLVEINARSAGGIGITINAGLNIPLLICQMLNGDTMKRVSAREGVYPNFPEIVDRQRRKSVMLRQR